MYAAERRQAIADEVASDGRVEVAALAHRFGVSEETIRRDLDRLQDEGVLQRVHGGAVAAGSLRVEPGWDDKAGVMAAEKRRIGKTAQHYVPTSGTVLIDAGTTTAALAALLPARPDLTVVTNALPIAMTLASRSHANLLLIGGRVRGRTLANVDDWALRTLEDLAVDVTFVATNGVSVERGLSTPDIAEAAVKRAIVAAGRRVVLLADHTKVGQEHFARFAHIGDTDVLVTDSGIDPQDVARFEEAGVEVAVA